MSQHDVKIVTLAGAKPQFVKAASVSRAFSRRQRVKEVLVATGQRRTSLLLRLFWGQKGSRRRRPNGSGDGIPVASRSLYA